MTSPTDNAAAADADVLATVPVLVLVQLNRFDNKSGAELHHDKSIATSAPLEAVPTSTLLSVPGSATAATLGHR